MRTPKFNKGQRIYNPLDAYCYMTITDITRGDIDDEPVYKVNVYAKNTDRFITRSVICESNASANP
jgi:hypothetical protein